MLDNPLLQNAQTFYRKELKLKHTIYTAIFIIYGVFLLLFVLCILHALIIRDSGCDKYVPYLILAFLGNICYIICFIFNIFASFRLRIKVWIMKFAKFSLLFGICFKVTFIIFSIVIYDRSYGDCYFPYKTQLIFMIGSFFEMIFLVFLQNFWSNNEKILKH